MIILNDRSGKNWSGIKNPLGRKTFWYVLLLPLSVFCMHLFQSVVFEFGMTKKNFLT